MKVLVVGGGGREHAIIKKISENPQVTEIYATPGNAGISEIAKCVPIKADSINEICDFSVKNKIDFAVVAPDNPLVMGCTDLLEENGIRVFGPNKVAAIIEGSKIFSKKLMKKYNIPTADYEAFSDFDSALEYIEKNNRFPIVIKADGLALGKGVIIANSLEESKVALSKIMLEKSFGNSGNNIVIEEFLAGPEITVLAFCDGTTIKPMISSMDHKRAFDNDEGENTGGMGVIAPNPFYTKSVEEEAMSKIILPTVNALKKEGRMFKGCLYFGLMLTKDGLKVIEYNCRFGDPECQTVLMMLETDLLDIMQAVASETLENIDIKFKSGFACCVVAASKGYPKEYKKGFAIDLSNFNEKSLIKNKNESVSIFHAGTALAEYDNRSVVTSGGRVLNVVAYAETLDRAVELSYEGISKVHFEGMFFRTDIGKKAKEMQRRLA